MKRTLIIIVALVGVGGLIGLLSYHPKSTQVGAATSKSPKSSASASPSSSSSPSSSGDSAGASTNDASSSSSGSKYKDGTYSGETVDVGFGPVQVQAVVSGGKLTAVNFLQMPSDQHHSQEITAQAEPILRSEALAAQSANINTVSGATQDSDGFVKSLTAALNQANS
jgi:uncharacterized protein with FMN-binding domain